MRRTAVIAMLAVMMFTAAGQVHAAQASGGKSGITIDGSLLFATEPLGGYDSTVGLGVGALVDLSGRSGFSSKTMQMGIRGDIAYFDWDGKFFGIGVSYKRLAFFGGPRFTFLPTGKKDLMPYVEGGLELTYDDVGVYAPGLGSTSTTGLSLGLAGGGGIDFALAPNLKLGINGRLHMISDSFMTIGVTLGLMF